MSDTHVNAYKLELAEKEAQLMALQGEVDHLKKVIRSMEAEDKPEPTPEAEPEVAPEAPAEEPTMRSDFDPEPTPDPKKGKK